MKPNKFLIAEKTFFILLTFFSLSACAFVTPISKAIPREHLSSIANKISGSTQIILAINDSDNANTAKIYALQKLDNKWNLFFDPVDAMIGKNGFAKLGEKREGDGKTPSGIFSLRTAFGYDKAIKTRITYRQALTDDIWIDDVNAVDYNRWVKKKETAALSYEKMRRDDDLYKYGVVIEYNTSPVVKGYGSAIFLHVWGGRDVATAGCIAISEENILHILEWLNPDAKPMIIMGTKNTI